MGWAPLYLKQVAWVVIGGLTFLVMSAYDYHRLSRYAYVLYAISLLLLVMVFLEGSSTRGAQRWLVIGSFSFQPSEVAKVTLVLLLARYYSTHSSKSLMNQVIIPGTLMFQVFCLFCFSLTWELRLRISLCFLLSFSSLVRGFEV